ncbi:hypothetical protein [[Pseudomonas] boreopolis]|uniref:hypothetical protein n=1 Tax=Xanthomonas boreopolis TaxID=86183 RepID=UPI003D9B65BE
MASYDVLREIVGNGSNLVLSSGVSYDLIRELAATAKRTGAKLTVTTSISYDLLRELSAAYGNTITFVDGLDNFKKD